jgi:addiction module RelE/StbE family toxin
MKVVIRREFKKSFKKLPIKIRTRFGERLEMLLSQTDPSLLRIHQLSGDKYPLLSMNVTGDYRALFMTENNTITFYEIGTHSELYK